MSDVLTTANSTYGLTLTEAKAHLNVSSTADDTLITSYIKAAVLLIENKTNRALMWQTRTLKMDTFSDSRYIHNRRIYPARSPLKSVTSLKYVDTSGTTTTMPSSDYIVSTGDQHGFIAEAYDATWPNTYGVANDVTITYVAGHSSVSTTVPENIKHAAKMVIGHWYRNREAVLTGTISKEIELGVDALLESEMTERYS